MKKKLFIILISAFLLTGCDLEYNVKINTDLTTTETIEFFVNNASIEEEKELYGDEDYNNYLDSSQNILDNNNYTYKYEYTDEGLYVTATKSNNSLTVNETIFNKKYSYYDFYCNDDYCMLYAVGLDEKTYGEEIYNLNISIQVPYKVILNNADEIDKFNNIYTWNNNVLEKSKDIKLIFERESTDVVKRNRTFYFITLVFFAIIALTILIFLIKVLLKIRNTGRI